MGREAIIKDTGETGIRRLKRFPHSRKISKTPKNALRET